MYIILSKTNRKELKKRFSKSLVDYALNFGRNSLQAMEIRHIAVNHMDGQIINS